MAGVIQRLEKQGPFDKSVNEGDARSQRVKITPKGQALFERIFPDQMSHLKVAFDNLT